MISFLKKMRDLYIRRPIGWILFLRPVWLFRNRKYRKRFQNNRPVLNELQKKILRDLQVKGISITHVNELFPDQPEMLITMLSTLHELSKEAKQDPKKGHFKCLWDTRKFFLDVESIFVRFPLEKRVVDIANSYMNMWSRLILSNGYVANIMPIDEKMSGSQNWHRDRHDIQLAKVLLYLTDVDTDADGPFSYVQESHPGGKWGSLFPQPKPYSKRVAGVNQESLNRVVPKEYIKKCFGKKGTIIFVDTTGMHKGGYCTDSERVLLITAFASSNRFSKTHRLGYPSNTNRLKAYTSPEAAFAVHLDEK